MQNVRDEARRYLNNKQEADNCTHDLPPKVREVQCIVPVLCTLFGIITMF